MVSADSAVVGEEYIRSACCEVEETQHEFRVLVNAACSHGDDLDAVLGEVFNGFLQTLDDLIGVVRRSVKDQEGYAGTCRLIPGEFL